MSETSKYRQIIIIRKGSRELRKEGWFGLCFKVGFMDRDRGGTVGGVIVVEVGIVKVNNNRDSMPADPSE